MGVDKRGRDLNLLDYIEWQNIKSSANITVDDDSFAAGDSKALLPSLLLKDTTDAANAAQSSADAAQSSADAAQSSADLANGKADAAQSSADAAQSSADANTAAISNIKTSLVGDEFIGDVSGSKVIIAQIGATMPNVNYIPSLTILSLGDTFSDNNITQPVIFQRTLTSFSVLIEETEDTVKNLRMGWVIDGAFR